MALDLGKNQTTFYVFKGSKVKANCEFAIGESLFLFEELETEISYGDGSINNNISKLGNNVGTCDAFHTQESCNSNQFIRVKLVEVKTFSVEILIVLEEDLLISVTVEEMVNTCIALLHQVSFEFGNESFMRQGLVVFQRLDVLIVGVIEGVLGRHGVGEEEQVDWQ